MTKATTSLSDNLSGHQTQTVRRPIDPLDYAMDKEGVINFYWPYTRREAIDFEETLSQHYCEVIGAADLDELSAPLLKIMQKYFINEAVGLFQSCLLKNRSIRDGVEFDFSGVDPKDWRLWPAIFDGKVPEKPVYQKKLLEGPVKSSVAKKIFKFSSFQKILKILQFQKGGMSIEGLVIKPITAKALTENIISTQRHLIISQHAGEVNEDVIFSRSERFFSVVSREELEKKQSQPHPAILDELITAFEEMALESGGNIDEKLLCYFRDLCYEQYCLLSIHFNRILDRDMLLPKRLWIGTGGYLWDALLACAVRLKDGHVCGHDHGSGLAHVTMGFSGFIDLWLCDEYWTFCEGQAKDLLSGIPAWAYMGSTPPLVHFPKQEKIMYDTFSLKNFKQSGQKTIYVLSTIYDRDRGRHCPLMPDITQIDWQARLIVKLKEWGYNVVIKAHPESPYTPPEFFKELGAIVTQEPLENIIEVADIFLFDLIYTSVFRAAMATNKPIIITDFENIPWTDKAKGMIDKRCALLSGGFDQKNRVQIDWNNLKDAIDEACKKEINYDFLSYYYNDCLIKEAAS